MDCEQVGECVEVCTEEATDEMKADPWKALIAVAPIIKQHYALDSIIERDLHDLVDVSNGSSMNSDDLLCAYARLAAHSLLHHNNPRISKKRSEQKHRKREVRRNRNAAVDKLVREWTDLPETTISTESAIRLDTHFKTLFQPKIRGVTDVEEVADIKTEDKSGIQLVDVESKTCQPEPNTNSTVKRRGITQNKCLDCGTSKLSTRAKRCLSCFATFRSDTKAKNRQVKKKPIPLSYPENLDVENEEANNVLQTVTPREDQSDATESLSPMKCVNKSRACNVCGKQVSPQSSGRCRSCYLGSRKRSAESSLELQSPIIQTPLPAIEVIDLTLDDDSEPETLEQPIKCSKCNKQRSEFKDHMCSDCYKKHKNNSTASNSQNDDVIFEVPAIPSARTSRSPIVSNVSAIDEHCSSTDYAVVPYSNLYYDLRVRPDTRNKCGSCGHSLKNGERRCSRCQSFHQANRTVAIYKQPRSEYSLDMRDTSSSSRALSVLSSTALTVSKVEKRKTSKCHACPTMIVPNKSGYCRACYNQFRHVASHSSPKKPKLPNSATNFEVSNDDEFNETTDRESSLMLPITQYRNQVLHTNNPADKQESSRAYYSEQLNESSDTNHNSFSDNYWTVV